MMYVIMIIYMCKSFKYTIEHGSDLALRITSLYVILLNNIITANNIYIAVSGCPYSSEIIS